MASLCIGSPAVASESAEGSRTCSSPRTLGVSSQTFAGSTIHTIQGGGKAWVNTGTGVTFRYLNNGLNGAWEVWAQSSIDTAYTSCDL